MRLKWPYHKKNEEIGPSLSEDIKSYYNANRHERVWVAWLLAVGTVLVTIGIAVGLYFAGRWIYEQLTSNTSQQTTQTSQGNKSSVSTPSKSSPNDNPTKKTISSSAGTSTKKSAANSTISGNNNTLTNTGPGNDIAVFFIASIVFTIIAQTTLRQKKRRSMNT